MKRKTIKNKIVKKSFFNELQDLERPHLNRSNEIKYPIRMVRYFDSLKGDKIRLDLRINDFWITKNIKNNIVEFAEALMAAGDRLHNNNKL